MPTMAKNTGAVSTMNRVRMLGRSRHLWANRRLIGAGARRGGRQRFERGGRHEAERPQFSAGGAHVSTARHAAAIEFARVNTTENRPAIDIAAWCQTGKP